MNIKLDMYEVINSLKTTGHLPKDYDIEEVSVSFNKWEGRKKKAKWETEVLCDCSELSLFGFVDNCIE